MKNPSNMFVISLIAVGLVIVPAVSMNSINSVIAQSQSATSQQTSQPLSQNNSEAQVGQLFTFNEKSKPANDPREMCCFGKRGKRKSIARL